MNARWYVARVQVGRQKVALEHLKRQGFETFAPVVERLVIKKGQNPGKIDVPLLAAYMFIRFDAGVQVWQRVNSTRGVVRLLPTTCEAPIAVPPGLVEELQDRVNAGEFAVKVGVEDEVIVLDYRAGDAVPIVGGLMMNKTGTFIRQVGNIIELNVALLGRPVVVGLPSNLVAPPER